MQIALAIWSRVFIFMDKEHSHGNTLTRKIGIYFADLTLFGTKIQ